MKKTEQIGQSKTLYFEKVKETFNGVVISSTISVATKNQIDQAKRLHLEGKCPHNIIYDEYGWLYDFRICATCGKGLGTV